MRGRTGATTTSRAPDEVNRADAVLPFPLQIAVRGPVPGSTVPYAREKVAAVARVAGRPVHRASVVLTWEPSSRRDRPAVIEATLDVGGHRVVAHAAGHDGHEAVDLLQSRLRRRLDHLSDRR